MIVRWFGAVLRRVLAPKERPPLAQARRQVEAAVAILRRHERDPTFRPCAKDLVASRLIEHDLFSLAATARRLVIRLERRFRGEPEVNEAKWR
jgi:hypothetical protein